MIARIQLGKPWGEMTKDERDYFLFALVTLPRYLREVSESFVIDDIDYFDPELLE